MIDTILSYPVTYIVSVLVCFGLMLEVAIRPAIAWRIPFLVTAATVFAWYLVEPVYTYQQYSLFDPEDVSATFLAVILFLLSFRFLVPLVAGTFDRSGAQTTTELSPEVARKLLLGTALLWVALAAIGSWRMDWNVSAALFPNGRTETGSMWTREAVATGGGESLVAVAGYIYILVLAVFGILAVFVQSLTLRAVCVVLILLSWPYAFLLGARNVALAVCMPGFMAFLLYGRASLLTKVVIAVVTFIAIDQAFRVIIAYRNIGFDHVAEANVENVQHAGLNMASELTNIVGFLRVGILKLQWGYGYLADLCQLIPRAIWPDKPMIGIDYAIARGFASTTSSSGVNVSIAQGMIGGGVRQFGPLFGPVAVAGIMAAWVRILTQLSVDHRMSRVCLYLLGLALTFNLGRDITLLVLWPFVFGYVGVVLYESVFQRVFASRR